MKYLYIGLGLTAAALAGWFIWYSFSKPKLAGAPGQPAPLTAEEMQPVNDKGLQKTLISRENFEQRAAIIENQIRTQDPAWLANINRDRQNMWGITGGMSEDQAIKIAARLWVTGASRTEGSMYYYQ